MCFLDPENLRVQEVGKAYANLDSKLQFCLVSIQVGYKEICIIG